MRAILPYPLLALSLLVMWLLLNGVSVGHLVLGTLIAIFAARTLVALEPTKPRIRAWHKIPVLFAYVFVDVVRSNIAVARIALLGRGPQTVSGFVTLPLELRDRTALAVLACIITSTPGTAWVEYRSRQNTILIHVLDLKDQRAWIAMIKERYERLLMEIFE